MVPATSPRGFPLRRDLKGCFEFQAQNRRSANAVRPNQLL
jgi:hypothetical protein